MELYDLFERVATSAFGKLLERTSVFLWGLMMKPKEPTVLLKEGEVAAKLKIHRTTLLRIRRRDKTFPKPVSVGTRLIRWRLHDIERWISAQR